jgi:hypothetical protein
MPYTAIPQDTEIQVLGILPCGIIQQLAIIQVLDILQAMQTLSSPRQRF